MKLSASQAAKKVGKSIPTITRAIKSGKLSAKKLEGGGYEIDPSELFRVWPAVTKMKGDNPNMLGSEIPNENIVLRVELEKLRQQLDTVGAERERERSQLSETIDDLRRRLDESESERRSISRLIEDQRTADQPKRGFWGRMFGS